MKTKKHRILIGFTGLLIIVILISCPVTPNEIVKKPVGSIEVLNNWTVIPSAAGGNLGFSVTEGKSVVLSARLYPEGVPAGINWQTSRRIVGFSDYTGPETILSALFGGETLVTIRAKNVFNEIPVFQLVNVKVIPVAYYKWSYERDGWRYLPALNARIVDDIYNRMLVYAGTSSIHDDPDLGGLVMEGPSTLLIGSALATATNSPYPEDPLLDLNSQLNFAVSPNGLMFGGERFPLVVPVQAGPGIPIGSVQPHKQAGLLINDEMYTGKVRISVEYEILSEPAFRQGLRIQVNNNTLDRDMASVFDNWLVAEYTADLQDKGILSGIFDVNAATFAGHIEENMIPGLPEIVLSNIDEPWVNEDTPSEMAEKRLRMAKARSFVCLSLPDGKILIRSIRIEAVN